MSVHAYTPPQGRPRSTPPLPNGEAPHPVMDTEGAVAAYVAGMPTVEMRRHIGHAGMKRLLDIVEARGIPLRRGRYNKFETPPAQIAAKIVSPEVAANYRRAGQASFAREDKACRALCRKLNKTETEGEWMTSRQTVERGLFQTVSGVDQRVRNHGWKRQDGAGKRLSVYLVPYGSKLPRPILQPGMLVEIPPPVRLSLWQRIVGWFK